MRGKLFHHVGLPAALLLALAALVALAPDWLVLERARWIIAALALAFAAALPWRAGLAWIAFCLALGGAAAFLSDAKVSLTEMPLTWLDLRIALANPAGFLGAIKVSPPAAFAGLGVVVVLVAALIALRLSRLDWRTARANLATRAVGAGVAAVLAVAAVAGFAKRLETALAGHEYAEIANMPDGLKLISDKIGAGPFLLLTALYDASTSSPFRDLASLPATPAHAAVGAQPTWLKPLAAPAQQPDIFVVLLESTFDISRTFPVTPEVTSPLLPVAQAGQLQGELGVNAIGGGTWITEFEAITGIPSRLFGYAGYYTHVELAPYVKGSLATHLKARGYSTLALYPVEGKFYGARAAYARYGFETYRDGVEFGIQNPWYAEDTEIVSRYIGAIEKADADKPLFAFALTMENHSPHPCTRFGGEAEMPYRFVGDAASRATCELNEYVARFRSTETAIAMLETALRARAAKTGRPYVLAFFGDHQPNTFTGTAKSPLWQPYDYAPLRRIPNDETFYQIRSSMPSPFATKTLNIPVVMLPTLLSAYVARDGRDVFLPGNFAIQAGCGERIALPRLNAAYGTDAALPESERKSQSSAQVGQACRSALVAARPDYLKLIDMP